MKNWLSSFVRNNNGDAKKEQKRKELFQSAFNASPDGYFVYSKRTQEILEVNETVRTLFELPGDTSLKGLYISQVMMRYLTGDSPNIDFLLNNLTETWKGEATFRTHNRKVFDSFVTTRLFSFPNPEEDYLVMSIHNISARKEIARELAQSKDNTAKATQAKAKFLSSMSHELRTPLNGIIGSSDLILCEPGVTEAIRQHVDVIKYSSNHMLNIINDILSFTKLNAGRASLKVSSFNLLKCLKEISSTYTLQFKTREVDFICDFPPALAGITVKSDELKLSQVLHNLLANALKFTEFGSVHFAIEVKEKSDSEIVIYFEVRDTGIGIANDDHKNIFNAFTQVYADDLKRKYGGTGLGLPISKQIVSLFGSELEVESELHKGSCFHFTCKFKMEHVHEAKESEVNTAGNQNHKDIRGIRALVVEDNEINARILKSFLTKWEIQIKAAITGVHAVELVKYHKFDIILMDLEMPEMNGYTALKIIREMGIDTPVIAFTATLLEDLEDLISESGFTDYVLKPFRPDDLRRKLEKYCERKVDYV